MPIDPVGPQAATLPLPHARRPRRWPGLAAALASLASLALLAACQTAPAGIDGTADVPAAAPVAAPAPAPAPEAAAPTASAKAATPPRGQAREQDLLDWSLAYAEKLRQMPPAEVAATAAAIGEPGSSAQRQMQLALALMHAPPPGDTTRALGLLQRVISHPSDEAQPLKPLARLLATRLATQRKLEEGNDRLSQQWREAQRRIELLNDQLDAMRAIERSLLPPPAAAPRR